MKLQKVSTLDLSKRINESDVLNVINKFSTCFLDDDFERAHLVLFVALSEPRMLFISDKEESPLGTEYRRAKKLDCKISLII